MARARKKLPPPVPASRAKTLQDVTRRLDANGRVYDEALLRAVYDFSQEAHAGQRRRSGEPYFLHPVNVAFLLADLRFDYVCVAVGLLHDVLEDTLSTRQELADRFGEEIVELVDGVTKISRHEYVRRDDAQAETFRKLILASAKDIRVVLVKLADRLHNMQTLQHLSPEARRRISRETLEIYAPIAHRLGMSRLKGDLEDLAFYFLWPLQYGELFAKIEEKMKLGQGTIRGIRDRLSRALESAGVEAEITFRVKRYYSIFQKLRRQGIDIDRLYDYLAFRVVSPEVRDCYAALGVVHQTWRPVPGRFKDYIAMPKPNLYQSLHTTVVGDKGTPFEVQIRTYDMDLIAEEGIAAHWQYKEGSSDRPWQADHNILWLRQLLEWQKEVDDPRTFLTTLKIDLYPDEVYLFTPKGDVLSFPRGATPVDFAYKVHTEVGHHCAGARVNGRLVPLRTELSNGDMVEVITNPNRNPSRDWLSFVVTARAKSKIRQWLNTEQKKKSMEIGRRLFEKEARKYKLNPKKVLESDGLRTVLDADGISNVDDLMSRIGFGKVSPRTLLERVLPGEQLVASEEEPSALQQAVSKILPFASGGGGPILVKGQDDLMTSLAKCCNPLPGEAIVGYVTRGRGVTVHSADCPNIQNLMMHPERTIDVKWGRPSDKAQTYRISLVLETEDRPGMLARLADAIAALDSNISHVEAETGSGRGSIELGLQVRDRKHLEKILAKLRSVAGVRTVNRRMDGTQTGSGA